MNIDNRGFSLIPMPDGGWIIKDNAPDGIVPIFVAAYSNDDAVVDAVGSVVDMYRKAAGAP